MTSTISFQGVSTGLATDQLVSAIIAADSQGVERLKARQTRNTERSTALSSLRTNLNALDLSLSAFYDKLSSQTVTSTDSDNTYVSATASGAAAGNYTVKVSQVATRGQLGPTTSGSEPTSLAVADANAAILSGTGSFAIRGTDGVVKTLELTNNSLNGLRDAINASGAGVTAAVVNTGMSSKPYQLVITAEDEGTGKTGGVVTLAAINNKDGSATTFASGIDLGIAYGSVDNFDSPTTLTGGLSSTGSGIATDAIFSVNGIEMKRQSNTVKDAVDGITFTLKKGDTGNSTTLNVKTDTATATSALQDVLSKYNAFLKVYTDNNKTTQDEDGEVTAGVFVGDATARSVINQVRTALGSAVSGISSSAAYKSGAAIGIKTASDGTLSLDTAVFKKAIEADQAAVRNVFVFSGSSTVGSVQFGSATSGTGTGEVAFNLSYGTGGAITGTLTHNGTTYSSANGDFTSSGGTLTVANGTLTGLTLNLTASGTGSMVLSRGIGSQLEDVISSLTSYTGTIERTRTSIDQQNKSLTSRIEAQQAILDKREAALREKFSAMEYTVAQLKAASGGLSG